MVALLIWDTLNIDWLHIAPAQVVDKEVDAAVDGEEEVGDQGQHRAPSHLLEIQLRRVGIRVVIVVVIIA